MEKRSLLSRGADTAGEQPAGLWWRQPEALLRAVVRLAAEDPEFAARVAREAGALARQSKRLREAFNATSRAAQAGAPKFPDAVKLMLLDTFELLTMQRRMPPAEAHEALSDMLIRMKRPASKKTVERHLSAARKLRASGSG